MYDVDFFFFQAEDGIRDRNVTGVQTCALPISNEEEKKYEERIRKMLARDPQDVAPVRAKPLPRKPLHSLTMPDGRDIETPRWTRDGKSIVFSHRTPDRNGDLHHDLFMWMPGAGVKR